MIHKNDNWFILENDHARRVILVDDEGIRTVSLCHLVTGTEFIRNSNVAEFQFDIDGNGVASYCEPSPHIVNGETRKAMTSFTFLEHEIDYAENGNERLLLRLRINEFPVELTVCYEILPGHAGFAKSLAFRSLREEVRISKMFIEMLNACPGEFSEAEFYTDHGLTPAPACFTCCGDEDILQLHNHASGEGLFVANTAAGPMRFFLVYPNWPSGIASGYSMSSCEVNKYLDPGETFTTDRILTCLYQGHRDAPAVRNTFREVVRRFLPQVTNWNETMYCTWLPFLKNIDEDLLLELAEQAAALGTRTFVVDDGWFVDGDCREDRKKFPGGLAAVSEHVRERGMQFGLWFNIGTDYGNHGTHPEENALEPDGRTKHLGLTYTGSRACRCLASTYRDRLVEKLISLTREYGVAYYKFDFSSIVTPYGILSPGCSSTEHAHHRDATDAVYEQYTSMLHVRERLKKEFPNLLIDFSFETFGVERPSIGALRYSEMHHITNLNTLKPNISDARKIRNTLYRYCTLLPNERLLGSLICLQGAQDMEHLLTACICSPLVAGDLRMIPPEVREDLASITAGIRKLGYLPNFCKLRGDRLIENDAWDGYARYSSCPQGFIALFANEARAERTRICIPDLPSGRTLKISNLLTMERIGEIASDKLRDGIEVDWLMGKTCFAAMFHDSFSMTTHQS
jgi:alpha-galactosidase